VLISGTMQYTVYSRVFLKILYNLYLGIEGVAKCMVNRLRPILGELISVNRNALVS
jgi:hypothetical protein